MHSPQGWEIFFVPISCDGCLSHVPCKQCLLMCVPPLTANQGKVHATVSRDGDILVLGDEALEIYESRNQKWRIVLEGGARADLGNVQHMFAMNE